MPKEKQGATKNENKSRRGTSRTFLALIVSIVGILLVMAIVFAVSFGLLGKVWKVG